MSSPCLPSLLLSLLFVLSLISATHLICNASDSITPTQPLGGTQTITSKNGVFQLGFFTPTNSPQRHYIGIWYKQVPEKTVVWVANRETPLPKTTHSLLKISVDGNLVLLRPSSNSSIWSTKFTSTPPSNSTVAVLLDSGNLVVRDGSDPLVIHWQSFAHPTNTFLSGSWIGIKNRKPGFRSLAPVATTIENSNSSAPCQKQQTLSDVPFTVRINLHGSDGSARRITEIFPTSPSHRSKSL